MIKTLKLKNFEPYKEACMDFSQYLNTIQGESNKGKSSLKRAFDAVISNNLGVENASYWIQKKNKSGAITLTDAVSVAIILDNDVTITRLRNNKVNQYIIEFPGQEAKILEGFGQSVPDEISELLNFGELNIKHQGDPSFLFFDTPGNVGKVINKIANLEIMDSSLKEVKSRLRKTNQDIQYKKDELARSQESFKKFEYLEEFNTLLIEGEEQNNRYTEKEEVIINVSGLITDFKVKNVPAPPCIEYKNEISELLDTFSSVQTTQEDLQNITDAEHEYKKAQEFLVQQRIIIDEKEGITTLIDEFATIADTESDIKDIEYLINAYKELDTFSTVPEGLSQEIADLLLVFEGCKDREDMFLDIEDYIQSVKTLTNDIKDLRVFIQEKKAELPNVCPTCGKVLE